MSQHFYEMRHHGERTKASGVNKPILPKNKQEKKTMQSNQNCPLTIKNFKKFGHPTHYTEQWYV